MFLKLVQERTPSVPWVLNRGSFDHNEEYDAEFDEMVKETERKIVKKTKEKTKKAIRVFSETWEDFFLK